MQLSHVLLEIEVATKPFGADSTRVWLLFVVCVHVKRQVVHLMERFVADLALILLFS